MTLIEEEVEEEKDSSAPKVLWDLDFDVPFYSSPIVGEDGTIYVGAGNLHDTPTKKSGLYAINPEDGRIKWTSSY